ncbi:MAG: helicase-related protein, partial [bacterium]
LFTDADRAHEEARKRIEAKKGIACHSVDHEKTIADKVADLAKKYRDSGRAILVFLRKLEDVERVVGALRDKEKLQVETLTGTLRGWERDVLASKNTIFARFMPNGETIPQEGTVYLICTSAGEVGVNISADHLVCDLTPFDSMTQRFGRVNRFGKGDARIDIVHRKFDDKSQIERDATANIESGIATSSQDDTSLDAQSNKKKDKQQSPYERACELTLDLMQHLPKRVDGRHGANPAALATLPQSKRQAAFTPPPIIPPASEILFDAWAMTTVRQKLPGRPPVADWLHGAADWESPETHVAWREEVGLLTQDLGHRYAPEDLLEDYPLKPHELLRDGTKRIFVHMQKTLSRCPDLFAWVIDSEGQVSIV